jgi:hypothetical protein
VGHEKWPVRFYKNALVNKTLVKNALVNKALVKNALVTNALVNNALVKNALVKQGFFLGGHNFGTILRPLTHS